MCVGCVPSDMRPCLLVCRSLDRVSQEWLCRACPFADLAHRPSPLAYPLLRTVQSLVASLLVLSRSLAFPPPTTSIVGLHLPPSPRPPHYALSLRPPPPRALAQPSAHAAVAGYFSVSHGLNESFHSGEQSRFVCMYVYEYECMHGTLLLPPCICICMLCVCVYSLCSRVYCLLSPLTSPLLSFFLSPLFFPIPRFFALAALGFIMAWLRVYCGDHTWPQVRYQSMV